MDASRLKLRCSGLARWISLCALGATAPAALVDTVGIPLTNGETVEVLRVRPENIPAVSPPSPGLILLHGGGWAAGHPAQLQAHAEALADDGYICLLPAYLTPEGGGVPTTVERARTLVAAIHRASPSLGVDPAQWFLLGESAGGHLAAMLATEAGGPAWAGLILWNPLLDLSVVDWLGAEHGMPFDLAAYSPLARLKADFPVHLIVHGADDTVAPVAASEAWRGQALALGLACRLDILPATGHAFAYPAAEDGEAGPGFRTALERTRTFLRSPRTAAANPGTFEIVRALSMEDGWQPFTGLAFDGTSLWGGGHRGGAEGQGTLFRVDPATRAFEVVHTFTPTEGREPFSDFAFLDGEVWGVTKFGGPRGGGNLFRWDPATEAMSFPYSFGMKPESGPVAWAPHAAPIVVDASLWGTTFHGGETTWGGALYRYEPTTATFTVVQSLTPETGQHPTGQLLHLGGWLYGTASSYGQKDPTRLGTLFRLRTDGSDFEVVHRFKGGSQGARPYDTLVAHPAGFILGTSFGEFGQPADQGTVFVLYPESGTVETLIDFNLLAGDGGKPNGPVVLGADPAEVFIATHGDVEAGAFARGAVSRLWLRLPTADGSDPRVSVERVERLHAFSGGSNGSTPMRRPVLLGETLWGVTAFGHAPGAAPASETQSGGLVYALHLPPSLWDEIDSLSEKYERSWHWVLFVAGGGLGLVLFFFLLRKR